MTPTQIPTVGLSSDRPDRDVVGVRCEGFDVCGVAGEDGAASSFSASTGVRWRFGR
ncbi:MAG: hypothetical protein ABI862_20150 [Ilumatobacteraceae bacterium]